MEPSKLPIFRAIGGLRQSPKQPPRVSIQELVLSQ